MACIHVLLICVSYCFSFSFTYHFPWIQFRALSLNREAAIKWLTDTTQLAISVGDTPCRRTCGPSSWRSFSRELLGRTGAVVFLANVPAPVAVEQQLTHDWGGGRRLVQRCATDQYGTEVFFHEALLVATADFPTLINDHSQ